MIIFFFYFSVVHLDLPVPTHSSPTRRSSALPRPAPARGPRDAALVRIPARSLPSGPARAAAGEPVRVLPPLHPRRGAVAAARGQHRPDRAGGRSEEHTSELQSLMSKSYAVFCLKKKKKTNTKQRRHIS